MPARENPSKLVNSVELSASAWAKTFSGARASAGAAEGAEADGCVDGMGLLAGGRAGVVDRQARWAGSGPGRARTSCLGLGCWAEGWLATPTG